MPTGLVGYIPRHFALTCGGRVISLPPGLSPLCVFPFQEWHSYWIRTHPRGLFCLNLFIGPVSRFSYILWWWLVSRSVVSDSLWPRELQHTSLPCPSPSLDWVCSDSCPLSQWCHATLSSSVVPFSSHLQSFPASGSFPMSQFFTSGGQSFGASASVSVLPMNFQGWLPLELAGLISLLSKGLQHYSLKPSVLWCSAFFIAKLSHPYMTVGKTKALTIRTFVGKIMSLPLNTLSKFVSAFHGYHHHPQWFWSTRK